MCALRLKYWLLIYKGVCFVFSGIEFKRVDIISLNHVGGRIMERIGNPVGSDHAAFIVFFVICR